MTSMQSIKKMKNHLHLKWLKKRHVAFAMILTGVLLVYFPDSYFLMLIGSFAYWIMWAFLGISLWYLIKRQYIFAFGGLVSVLLINSLFSNSWEPNAPNDLQASGIRIAHFNVLKFNNKTAPTVKQAFESDADLISFVEVDTKWIDALVTGLSEKYPYTILEPRDNDAYGLAVFSKYPLNNPEVLFTAGLPNIVGEICLETDSFHFVASHTKAPLSQANYFRRNRHIELLAEYVDQIEGPKVVMGDFNTVPWDGSIVNFKKDTNLSDSRKSMEGTYPAWAPVGKIPIDYIFHSEDFTCAGFSSLEPTNSDHLGIVGVYQWKG